MNYVKTVGSEYGHIEISPLAPDDKAVEDWKTWGTERSLELLEELFSGSSSAELYTWWPDPKIHNQLPDGFNLQFFCFEIGDSGRHLTPMGFSSACTLELFTGGLAIADHLKSFTKQRRSSYRIMSLIYQRVMRLRDYYGRRFQCRKDLQSPIAASGYNILPEGIGLSSTGDGNPWGISKLVDEQGNRMKLCWICR